jgi:8-oxo-dGTP pyrophosphatase MutT (NUDIX family)
MFLRVGDDYGQCRVGVVLAAACGGRDPALLVAERGGHLFLPAGGVSAGDSAERAAARLLAEATGVAARTGPGTSGFCDLALCQAHTHPENVDADGVRSIYLLYGACLQSRTPCTGGYRWAGLGELRDEDPHLLELAADALRSVI